MKTILTTNGQVWKFGILLVCVLVISAGSNAWTQAQIAPPRLKPSEYSAKPPANLNIEQIKIDLQTTGFSPASQLPLWAYTVTSSRDGNQYSGVMVGASPFTHGGQKNINVRGYVIPLIIVTNSIATSLDFNTGQFTTVPGVTTFDSTQPTGCLTAPNNIPSRLLAESPIFNRADFMFGSTDVGRTQYLDAFQRGNFWVSLGANNIRQDYHVLLNPVRFLNPIVINVPGPNGVAIADPLLFGPPPICPPMALIDIGWLDAYLQNTVLPQLTLRGVGPANLPMFLTSNVQMYSAPLNFNDCCFVGYHGANGSTPVQTYLVSDFDSSQFYLPPNNLAIDDTGVWSHEVTEWMNDPTTSNPVPAWGHIGQQSGCQNNLEVGDPLTGTAFPAVTMRNGFTYHLQELAFFSWFFGGESLGANGWYSDNGTFQTDAGPVCQ